MTISKLTARTLMAVTVIGIATMVLGIGSIVMLMAALALKYLWIALLA